MNYECKYCLNKEDEIEVDGELYCKEECSINYFDIFTAYINHPDLDFVGYEFEIDRGVFIDEYGGVQYLFRLDVDKETKDINISSAYSEDYDVMEYAGQYFDNDVMLKKLQEHVIYEELQDDEFHGEEWLKENE